MAVVIVGTSVAGIRTAQALRMHGYAGTITLVGEEVHPPYDKPPLSKQHLITGTPVALVAPDDLAALDLDLRLGVRASALDPQARIVHLADGGELSYATLVIATGVRPRTLPGAESIAGVHTIRTADDAAALRAALAKQPRVVVVGGGFIGSEFASAAREFGCDVSIIEAQPTPMAAVLGPRVGAALSELHRLNGVNLRTGVSFDHFELTASGAVAGVVCSDGSSLPAELVVVGIGAVPATEWLASSGLPLDNGVACDDSLHVLGYDDIYAVGDVASWPHGLYGGRRLRIEHWTNANEHAAIVAAGLLRAAAGAAASVRVVGSVWPPHTDHRTTG